MEGKNTLNMHTNGNSSLSEEGGRKVGEREGVGLLRGRSSSIGKEMRRGREGDYTHGKDLFRCAHERMNE